MRTSVKILLGVVLLIMLSPLVIGLFQPKYRVVVEKGIIDKMYFFIIADVTNHWEEPKWRHDIDTIVQKDVVDGQDAWMEYYTNGDSILLITQKTTGNDYIRLIITPDGQELNRVITVIDYKGKAAIRITEEAYEKNPLKRFLLLFDDPVRDRLKRYLYDLKEKNKPEENTEDTGVQ